MRVIIPMSGEGARFKAAGYLKMKPLISVYGKSILERLLAAFPSNWPKTFICTEDQAKNLELLETLHRLAPGSELITIKQHKLGPVWAVLDGLRKAKNPIPENEPLLINYCDFAFQWDAEAFSTFTENSKCDGAVLCYTGFHPEYIRPTLYAYCRNEGDRILEIKEKGHFTPDRTKEFASSGSYFFKSVSLVKRYFQELMDNGPLLNGEGYASVPYSFMIRDKLDIRLFPITGFDQFGTPQDVADYEYWANTFSIPARQSIPAKPMQLLMPMAGRGSRFKGEIPKPLLPVLGKAMYVAATESLPKCTKYTFVVRKEFESKAKAALPIEANFVSIEGVTEGQAITCALAEPALDPNLPLLVSSCDHGLLYDEKAWNDLRAKDPDVIVWGQRNYPGADCTPSAFAYIQTAAGSDKISYVSVKMALSESPRKDLLLVGTFYFKSSQLMLDLIRKLKEKNIRVNGEFYLDSVINLAIEQNLDVRVFESESYLCWGTETSLQEFNYWQNYFSGNLHP